MIAMPKALFDLWSPMWSAGSLYVISEERPWWRMPGYGGGMQRCDGRTVGRVLDAATMSAMAPIDCEHPLPKPPLMAGQVWVVLGGDGQWRELTYLGVTTTKQGAFSNGYLNLHSDAILVAGPTPWGRDVPWTPTQAVWDACDRSRG